MIERFIAEFRRLLGIKEKRVTCTFFTSPARMRSKKRRGIFRFVRDVK